MRRPKAHRIGAMLDQKRTIKQALADATGKALWRFPGNFKIVKLLGANYVLRCALFHDIADQHSPFTAGLGVTMSRRAFEGRICFLARHYTPIDVGTFLAAKAGKELPPRPVLVTFDDAYASVAEVAAPICAKYRVPVCFFINAQFVGNRDMSLDNLICYVSNTIGLGPINTVVREFDGQQRAQMLTRAQVIREFVPSLSLERRNAFKVRLAAATGTRIEDLAHSAALYVRDDQLVELESLGCEIGNHTYSHVHCRILSASDFSTEIDRSKDFLEQASQRKVRVFSVPYGSIDDLTPALVAHLRKSAYEAAFLVESRVNTAATDFFSLNRIGVRSESDAETFSDIEFLPRLRSIADLLLGCRNVQ
jgi:peptidoglycan/xylan/chitin deacetylase (PgdA/CDA1 family)